MIRVAEKSDERALRAIWQEAFADETEYEDLAWSRFEAISRVTAVTDKSDIPVSLACLYDSGGLQKDGETSRFPCIYGVGTRIESRGHGYAMDAIDELLCWCKGQHIASVMIAPAEESLFGLYERRFGFTPYFSVAALHIRMQNELQQEKQKDKKNLTPVSAETYGKIREDYLKRYAKNIPYVSMSKGQLLYEQELLNLAGGSFFCEFGEGTDDVLLLGAYEKTQDGIFFPELLTPPGKAAQIISRIRPYIKGKNVNAYLPVFAVTDAADSQDVTVRPYAMRLCLEKAAKKECSNPTNTGFPSAYAGFIFD